jgi:hypothetical protein
MVFAVNISDLKLELDLLVARAEIDRQDAALFRRILVQAVMTAGGTLMVDPALADKAKEFQGNIILGNGTVRLESE